VRDTFPWDRRLRNRERELNIRSARGVGRAATSVMPTPWAQVEPGRTVHVISEANKRPHSGRQTGQTSLQCRHAIWLEIETGCIKCNIDPPPSRSASGPGKTRLTGRPCARVCRGLLKTAISADGCKILKQGGAPRQLVRGVVLGNWAKVR
jgi:hypothetical protein